MMNRIVEALEGFNLPIFYGEIPEDQLDDMHFFYYRPSRLDPGGTAHFLKTYEIAYVSVNQDDLREESIIDALMDKGLRFKGADYERVQMVKTSEYVDIVIFTVAQPLRRKRCRG